jgi:hypothetical protein
MNEKAKYLFAFIGVCFVCGIFAAGFFLGRGNLQQPAGPADADQRIERTLEELGRELELERAVSAGLRANSEREGAIIDGIAESTRQARTDAQSALSLGGGAADSLQAVIVQMEIYNRYVGDIERRLGGYSDLPGGQ